MTYVFLSTFFSIAQMEMANENVTLLILHHLIGSLICIISRACSCFYFGRVVSVRVKKCREKWWETFKRKNTLEIWFYHFLFFLQIFLFIFFSYIKKFQSLEIAIQKFNNNWNTHSLTSGWASDTDILLRVSL